MKLLVASVLLAVVWLTKGTDSYRYRYTDTNTVRVDGDPYFGARVEVLHDGEYGTICHNDQIGNAGAAKVLCKMLGMTGGEDFVDSPSADKMWLLNIWCQGTEDDIDQCSNSGWGVDTGHCQSGPLRIKCEGGPDPTVPLQPACNECDCPFGDGNHALTCKTYCSCQGGSGCVLRCPETYDPNIEICQPIGSVSSVRNGVCSAENDHSCSRGCASVTVKDGETLDYLSAQYGAQSDCVAAINKVSGPLTPGSTLIMPNGWCVKHTVESGENAYSIAWRYGTTATCIKDMNSVTDSTIRQGATYRIPLCPYEKYTVKYGDTLAGIADRFGTSVALIRKVNDIADGSDVALDQVLIVPYGIMEAQDNRDPK